MGFKPLIVVFCTCTPNNINVSVMGNCIKSYSISCLASRFEKFITNIVALAKKYFW